MGVVTPVREPIKIDAGGQKSCLIKTSDRISGRPPRGGLSVFGLGMPRVVPPSQIVCWFISRDVIFQWGCRCLIGQPREAPSLASPTLDR